jgi:CyaY protein
MTESEFIERAEATLRAIETAVDGVDADLDCTRAGGVLTLELDNGSRIVVNTQMPTRQIWVAARSGGFHYGFDGQRWRDTRDGSELFAALSRLVSSQGGRPVVLGG